ncbi:protein of unknown function [Rhodovastum atsumiense]|nr:protein of unknown function [Rhodovastum atsumiense]
MVKKIKSNINRRKISRQFMRWKFNRAI